MENLSLSVPDLLTTVKQFVQPEKHEQLDQMLQRYMQKELGKQQLQLELRLVAGREALRRALLAMVPQIDELQKKRELMKQQQQAQQRQQVAAAQGQQQGAIAVPNSSSNDGGLAGLGPLQATGTVKVESSGGASSADGSSNGQVKPEPGVLDAPLAPVGPGPIPVKTEIGGAAPLAVPGSVHGQPPPLLPNVAQTPAAAVATAAGASVPMPNGVAGGGVAGGAVVPAGGGAPVAGAPGAVGSSSQGRKSTLPVQALVHAFHCTDPACDQKTCADTKQVLKRMEVHVQQCPTRRAQQSAAQGGPPQQQAECKVCKLWQALHRTKSSSGQHQSMQQRGMPPGAAGRGGPAGYRSSGGPTPQNQEAVRARLRQIDPAQVKRMLLSHVRACQNKQCQTCHKLRERIKSRAASSAHGGQGGQQRPPGTGHPGGGMSMGGGGGMGMGMGGGMGSTFNPLAGGGGGGWGSGGGWGDGGGMGGGWGGSGGGMGGGSAYQPHLPHTMQQQRPQMGPGGQQRRGIKRRGWEGAGGSVRAKSEDVVAKWAKVRMTLKGAPDWKKVAISLQPAARKTAKDKKRSATDGGDGGGGQSASAKRQRRDSHQAASKGGVIADEDEDFGLMKQAKDRPAELEQNKLETGTLIEVQLTPNAEWSLATIRGQGSDKLYTVQLEPAEANRAKPTGIPFSQLRLCCNHAECKKHHLPQAALPLFCDRCRKALMQSPQQRIYYQETFSDMQRADGKTQLRLCNTCHQSLRNEQKKGHAALSAEVKKFTRELVGGERDKLLLNKMEECHVPQRSPEHGDAPVLSNECDMRWVQCEHCHFWHHWVCAMYDDTQYKKGRPYYCQKCAATYEPVTDPVRELMANNDAVNLPQIPMGEFIEQQVGKDMEEKGLTCAPVTVRVVSSLLMTSYTPERLVQHQEALGESFPREFPYKSKALLAFQKRGGLDVCIFALYVQEYGPSCPEPNRNRVYISYLDSVRYFDPSPASAPGSEPAGHRSTVYHSMLVAYLQWTRMLGFKHVHIWVEPPKMGDEYIFFARSDQQRKPMKREKLREWYRKMLDKAKDKGIVDHYGSMHEHYAGLKSVSEIPLFHGDQWEITVPSLLGIDQDDPNAIDPKKVNPAKLLRMDAKDVVQKAQQEMQHLKRHFLVVVLTDPEEPPKKDEDPVISIDLTDTRQNFLGQCQHQHWQFNTLRHAQYSTMMILQHIHNKPSYCLESCVRGRVEDGSFMVGCDMCDNWYHADCVGVSKEAAASMNEYLCPLCKSGPSPGGRASGGMGGNAMEQSILSLQ